ncbi:MAG: DUF134 domain-containing protein [Candidatus Cloacimonetes bacterium]|nr:DUF134 domain-containing protein [Candidatus Cloacimonadota bacterium]
MSRPKKMRLVNRPPIYTSFKPIGVRRGDLEQIPLSLDEFEAIRLADFLGKDHSEAAEEMEISRSTFTRLIEKARQKVACFIIEGKHLFIEGGDIHFRGNIIHCQHCGHMFKTGFDVVTTVCPACGSHELLDLAGGFGHGKCCRGSHRKFGR